MPVIDRCVYCGVHYYPMAVWTKRGQRITVCYKIQCEKRARRAGFKRSDLG